MTYKIPIICDKNISKKFSNSNHETLILKILHKNIGK